VKQPTEVGDVETGGGDFVGRDQVTVQVARRRRGGQPGNKNAVKRPEFPWVDWEAAGYRSLDAYIAGESSRAVRLALEVFDLGGWEAVATILSQLNKQLSQARAWLRLCGCSTKHYARNERNE
jgi:hypothetical protein